MKTKNITNAVIPKVSVKSKEKNLVDMADLKAAKKANINVNTYMKKSKRNITPDVVSEPCICCESDVANTVIIPDAILVVTPDIKLSTKALNLIKAREARQHNIKEKNNSREEKIINLINEIKQEELLKVENKTEKLKNKLMKLI
jgi:hypothetical protein